MDGQASFAKQWGERFPGEKLPDLFPIGKTMNINNIDSGQSGDFMNNSEQDSLNRVARAKLLICDSRIKELETQLEKERFVRDYLVSFLGNQTQNGDSSTETMASTASVLNYPITLPGVDLPEPRPGDVCCRVVKGKKSRQPNANVTNNEGHLLLTNSESDCLLRTDIETDCGESPPPLPQRAYSRQRLGLIPKSSPFNDMCTGDSINKPAVYKCDGDLLDYAASESDPIEQAVSVNTNRLHEDKSTSTELSPELLGSITANKTNHLSRKTNLRPVPLPRPKKPRVPLPAYFARVNDKPAAERSHSTDSEISPGIRGDQASGTTDLNSLHSAGNSVKIRRSSSEPATAAVNASVEPLCHSPEARLQYSGELNKTQQNASNGEVFVRSLPTSISTPPVTVPGHPCEHTYSSQTEDLTNTAAGQGIVKVGVSSASSADTTDWVRQSVSDIDGQIDKTGTHSLSTADDRSACGDNSTHSAETMIRKLVPKSTADSDGITGITYKPRAAYESVEFTKGSPVITDSSTEKHANEERCTGESTTGSVWYDHDEGLATVAADEELDMEDPDIGEPLYETCDAALTAQDKDFDSASLYSSDSGVDSKSGVDGQQSASPESDFSYVDPKDPYAALYATVSKLKHGITDTNSDSESGTSDALSQTDVVETPTVQKRTRVPEYEYVDIGAFANETYDTKAVNDPPRSSYRAMRREHDYEDCIPPGLTPDPDYSSTEPPDKPKESSSPPELPVKMRLPLPGGKAREFRNSQDTVDSQRNSYPMSTEELESSDSDDNTGIKSPEREKQRLRELVLRGILATETEYLACLEVLCRYKQSLEGASITSQPVISQDDISTIFYKIPELFAVHQKFVDELAARLDNWTPLQTVGDLFKVLILHFPVYSDYIKNYPKAVETISRCSEDKPLFKELADRVSVHHTKEKSNLQDMLFKPVVRIQRNTLVLGDLINCTPRTHPDHVQLEQARSVTHANLEHFDNPMQYNSRRKIEHQQHLVKNSFMVESVGGQRKLRYIFLFNDVIICTKQKISSRSQRHDFEVKWYAPLTDIVLSDHRMDQQGVNSAEHRDSRLSHMEALEDLKKRVSVLKTELRKEMKKEKENESKEKSWISSRSTTKNIEKLKKKLHEQEAALVQASPNLPFKIYHKSSSKWYVFLMSTDYEREEWAEAIKVNQKKFKSDLVSKPPTAYDIQMLIENVKQIPKVNSVGSVLLRSTEEEGLNGMLNVTIHRLSGLSQPSDTFCCLELDSYGHFFMTARTNVCRGSDSPVWDEEFEIDLDGSQTLRILCYRRGSEMEGDTLLGKSALELKTCWLREKFREKVISLNQYSVVVSIRHVTAATTMKRAPSKLKTGVFGVKITTLARREQRKLPTVVTACIKEIERRGMEETGLYRVSGVTSDVQRLKKAFDKNSRGAVHLLAEFDIHAVSGVLKLYFRELPEPLFTEALYCNFIDSLQLTDAEAKEKCMMSLLHSLNYPSLHTVIYLIDHLIRVASYQDQNRMSINNLATIFGPTLLRPAAKDAGTPSADLLFLGAQEALSQTAVLYYFVKLREAGKNLNKQSSISKA